MRLLLVLFVLASSAAASKTHYSCMRRYGGKSLRCIKPYQTFTRLSQSECSSYCQFRMPRCTGAQYSRQERKCELFEGYIPEARGRGSTRTKREDFMQHPHRHRSWERSGGHRRPRPPPRPRPRPRPNRECPFGGAQLVDCRGSVFFQPTKGCASTRTTVTHRPTWRTTTTTRRTTPTTSTTTTPTTTTSTTTTTTTPSTTTTTEAPLPPEAECPAGQVERFVQIDSTELQGNDDFSFNTFSSTDCLDACTNNRLPDGIQAPCRSVDFDENEGICIISMEVLAPAGGGIPRPNPDVIYYEKICIDEQDAGSCTTPIWRAPQKILVGFAEMVTGAESLQDCVQQCIVSDQLFGFPCTSGMMFHDDTVGLNCVLNVENAQTQPDLFVDFDLEAVDYFETGCTRFGLVAIPSHNVLSKSNEWGDWTPCNSRTGVQTRFRNCLSSSPSTCEQDMQDC